MSERMRHVHAHASNVLAKNDTSHARTRARARQKKAHGRRYFSDYHDQHRTNHPPSETSHPRSGQCESHQSDAQEHEVTLACTTMQSSAAQRSAAVDLSL